MNIQNTTVQQLTFGLFKEVYKRALNSTLEYYKEETNENTDLYNLIGLITIQKDIKLNLSESTLDYIVSQFTKDTSKTLIVRNYEYDIAIIETDERYYIKLFFA